MHQLKSKIKATGPISVADYMREVLTNPLGGYYMHRDVFGEKGDFITSPEISQMFGEMIGIWCINEWMNQGSPKKIQVVELGPGRGTLSDDILRVFSQFPQIKDAASLHLVEVSPKLSEMQHKKLSGSDDIPDSDTSKNVYRYCRSKYGVNVSWYQHLKDVPSGFTFYVAHEFLDALPIYKFQKTDVGWREVFVDLKDNEKDELRLVLSKTQTAGSAILQPSINETRSHIEICPEAGVIVQELSERISSEGGSALLADYGHYGEKEDTFRAFKNHKLHDPLVDPGSADLTADVDFRYLAEKAKEKVPDINLYGPITQTEFLMNMGIEVRLQMLLKNSPRSIQKDLITGYNMLVNPKEMGERFKFFSLMKAKKDYKPAGFMPLQ